MELDLSTIISAFGEAMNHEIIRYVTAFSIAAWIHSKNVRKEIKLQMAGLIESIDAVRETLADEIKVQAKRIELHNERLDHMQGRIDYLANKPPCVNHGNKEGPQ
jgi:hypothetical protein